MRQLFLVLAVGLAACGPCRHTSTSTSTSVSERDTVYVSHYDTVRIVERDSLLLARLEQYHDKVVTYAQHSELSNAYCTSIADIGEDGRLSHTLDTRDSALIPARIVEVERIERDTFYSNTQSSSTSSSTSQSILTKKVKKPLSWFVRAQIIGFWLLAAGIIIRHRKKIIRVFSGWRI